MDRQRGAVRGHVAGNDSADIGHDRLGQPLGGDVARPAEAGDVVYIPFAKFHRTENPYHLPLSYVWITINKEG